MTEHEEKLDRSIRNSGFGALLCFSLGLVLLEAWLIRLDARPGAHLLTAGGAVVAALAYRALAGRYRAARQRSFDHIGDGRGIRPGALALALPGVALLIAFGYAGALALASGVVTLFGAFAIVACSFPWSRVGLCRTRILLPSALVIGTALLALPRLDQLPHPLLLPLSVWMLWLTASGAWIRNAYCKWRRPAASGFAVASHLHETERVGER
jgi:hypothetical protein